MFLVTKCQINFFFPSFLFITLLPPDTPTNLVLRLYSLGTGPVDMFENENQRDESKVQEQTFNTINGRVHHVKEF